MKKRPNPKQVVLALLLAIGLLTPVLGYTALQAAPQATRTTPAQAMSVACWRCGFLRP